MANKETGDYIYQPTYNLVPETKASVEDRDSLQIGTSVAIDYNAYDKIAKTWNAQVAAKRLCQFIDDVLAGRADMNKWSEGPLSRA